MDNAVPNVRFVRCPKCVKLIPEFANVPVYRCGGCSTVLRAKYHIASAENANSASPENSSQNLSIDIPSTGLVYSREQMVNSSTEVDNGAVQAAPSNYPSESISPPAEHGKHSTEGRTSDHGNRMRTDQQSMNLSTNSNEELDGSLRLSPHCQTDTIREPAEPIIQHVVSEEDFAAISDSRRSIARSSNAYYGSASSTDDGCNDRIPRKKFLLSKRTFGQKKSVYTADSKGKKAIEDSLVDGTLTTDSDSQSHAENHLARSPDGSPDLNRAEWLSRHGNDHIPCKQFLLSKRTFRQKKSLYTADSKGTKAVEDSLVDGTVTTDSDSQNHAENHLARSPDGSPDSNRAEWLSRHGIHSSDQEMSFNSEDFHSVENWMESESDANLRFLLRKSDVHGDAFNGDNDKPSANLGYVKPKQMKILKKVDELRDELTELFDQTVQGKRRSYLRGIREEDFTDGIGSDFVRSDQSAYLPRRDVHHRAEFSSPLAGRHNYSCSHCYHEDNRSSIQQPSNICLNCHPPKPVSPVQIASSLPTSGHQVEVRSQGLENFSKQKRQAIRRYCLPVVGGAPFVICYNCLRLLQLPADFLVSRKRLHKLQCGFCFKILVYSFRERPKWTPQTPIEVQHPPSEVESNPNVHLRDQMLSSNPYGCSQGDPVSFTEEYGLSFARSDSTDPEPVLHVSRNSSELTEAQNHNHLKDSQLHRLLGYNSASDILFQVNADGSTSTEPTTPNFHRPFQGTYARYGLNGEGLRTSRHEHLEVGTSSNNPGAREEDVPPRRSRIIRGAYPLRGLLKKGIRELNHGLENVKLKVQSNARKVRAQ